MNAIFVLSMALTILGITHQSAFAEDVCPEKSDPVYCKLANETGGKVIYVEPNGDMSEAVNQLLKDEGMNLEKIEEPKKRSIFSKDIGCAEYKEGRGKEICNSISQNLEWGWTGHASFAPGWRSKEGTIKKVFCEKNITQNDLPVLLKMCGTDVKSYLSCIKPDNARLSVGLEGLINTLRGQNEPLAEDLVGTFYDPNHPQYLLKSGCEDK